MRRALASPARRVLRATAAAIVVSVMLAMLIGITVTMGPFFHLTMLAHGFWMP